MKLTRFEELLREVQKLGASQVIVNLIKTLESGLEDLDPEDIVFGEHGLFLVDERGILTRVIVHIVDKPIDRFFPDETKNAIRNDDFDDSYVVKRVHKYHLVNCSTLKQAESGGWRDKYKMSQRRDGRFFYRFISDNKVYKINEDQLLEVCANCLKEINNKHKSNIIYTKMNFKPEIFFSDEFRDKWINDVSFGMATGSIPNLYQQDWKEISKKYKEKINYQCEGSGCKYPDLSKPDMRKYLHTHHLNMDKANNNYSNLEALCLACHADQPGHEHMKNKHYRDYLKLIKKLRRE